MPPGTLTRSQQGGSVGKNQLDRVVSDYLAVSRRASMYASTDDYLRAEAAAWQRLMLAVRRVERRALAA